MVHVDTGPVRQWEEGDFFENTDIGEFNPNEKKIVKTDKFFYRAGENSKLFWAQPPPSFSIVMEKFYRGKWRALFEKKDLNADKNFSFIQMLESFFSSLQPQGAVTPSEILPSKIFGKYRLKIIWGQSWQYSNEFYIKKK